MYISVTCSENLIAHGGNKPYSKEEYMDGTASDFSRTSNEPKEITHTYTYRIFSYSIEFSISRVYISLYILYNHYTPST